ncbi:diguanylate cyclase [Arcobacter arenosus]|uniref:diguanylate cyclase n=1 Tax=Arcobacter arenosus TaxID=2576037 RepID=UPI003BAB65BF
MKKLNKDLLESLTVLYVEDEEMIKEEVSFFCKRFIPNFHVASNGLEGIEVYKKINPDVIVTDIQMPKMNGIDMLRELKTTTPVIITTAFSDIEYFLYAIELKVNKFIIKPVDLKELLTNIQESVVSKRLQDRLFEKENVLKILDENVLMSVTDKDGNIIDASSIYCELIGYTKEELIGNTHSILRHEDTPDEFYKEMWEEIKKGKIFKSEIKNRKKNQEEFWSNLTITPVLNQEGEIENFLAIREDITNKKKLEQLAIKDETTDIYNRRYFNTIIEKENRRLTREKTTLSLAIIDVDYFKSYNDIYGHPKGDEALVAIANVLKLKSSRASDYAFRLGGEEFGLIFTSNSVEESFQFLESIIEEIESLKIAHENSLCSEYVTISAGLIIVNSEKLLDSKDMYRLADKALYEAKENGRNQVVLSSFNKKD